MREPVAVLSDIHGNVRALDRVLEEIARRGIRRIANLGDSLYGPFDPRPVADRLIGLGALTVSGNEDRILLEMEPASRTARFTRRQLERRHLDWLASLPRTVVDDDALFCHGTPNDDTVYLLSRIADGTLAARPGRDVGALLGCVPERLVLCGHDHTARTIQRGKRLIVNPGSVGCPAYSDDSPAPHVVESGSPLARFAVVSGEAGAYSAELISVPYPAAAAAAEARANGFPDWAIWIATGCVR